MGVSEFSDTALHCSRRCHMSFSLDDGSDNADDDDVGMWLDEKQMDFVSIIFSHYLNARKVL